jgi:putative DNA primase/helicase
MSAIDSFRHAMFLAGLEHEAEIVPDGRLHRFKVNGDSNSNSWYILFPDTPMAGSFGCWKRGIKETWYDKSRTYNRDETARVSKRWRDAEAARKEAEKTRQAEARQKAEDILSQCFPVKPQHPYLLAKSVAALGLLQYKEALVVPLRDANGVLHSLQFIQPDGSKRFLSGGRIQGCSYNIEGDSARVVICEGFATGASIHQATGHTVVCAMNSGNLVEVAKCIRSKYPEAKIIVAGDNDQFTNGNPGKGKADEAARAIEARAVLPVFKVMATKPTDFNDLLLLEGAEEVRRQINAEPVESDDQAYARLAKLSPGDYDRCRDAEAKKRGLRTSTLDAEVRGRREKKPDGTQGNAVNLPDVEPWPEPVGGGILSEVSTAIAQYVALPDGGADAVTLWIAHTHAYKSFTHSPRLNLCSPEKGCGKTTLIDVIGLLTPRSLRTESVTPAVIFRLADSHFPTLLLDECDTYLTNSEDLRGLLNAGHRKGATALRCEGDENQVRTFNAFVPAVLAGIGALPGTLYDRSIRVKLVRALRDEIKKRFDSRHISTEAELCRKLARWVGDNLEQLEGIDPQLPAGAFNRVADNWRPLFAVAQVAGGEWPERAAIAFAKLEANADTDEQGLGAMLLTDIRQVFDDAQADKMFSKDIVAALNGMADRPWSEANRGNREITPAWLSRKLKGFGIKPHNIWLPQEQQCKGYEREAFRDAFRRYLGCESVQPSVLENAPDSALLNGAAEGPESAETPMESTLGRLDGCEASKTGLAEEIA